MMKTVVRHVEVDFLLDILHSDEFSKRIELFQLIKIPQHYLCQRK